MSQNCEHLRSRVTDSRTKDLAVYRTRECKECGQRFSTVERRLYEIQGARGRRRDVTEKQALEDLCSSILGVPFSKLEFGLSLMERIETFMALNEDKKDGG